MATLLGLAGLPLLAVAPAQAVGAGGDCGGPDTPPAHVLVAGEECAASLDEPHRTTTHTVAGIEYGYLDEFAVDHTDGDVVTVTASASFCLETAPEGSVIAVGDGRTPISVRAWREVDPAGNPSGTCPFPGDYTISADVLPNDRPTASFVSVPAGGSPGSTVTIDVSGADGDGDLAALGVAFAGGEVDWKEAPSPRSSWAASFDHVMTEDTEVTIHARDEHGAVSAIRPARRLDLYESECGGTDDADGEHVTLPLACTTEIGGLEVDTFTFTVAAGRRPRVVTTFPSQHGYVTTLTSPSGVVSSAATDDPPLVGGDDPGLWRLDVRGDGDAIGYQLAVNEVGPAAPPSLAVDVASIAFQGDALPVAMRAVDPNGETVTYRLAWSDGSTSQWPILGRAASGATVTGYRRFLSDATSLSATVTATNEEGLSASRSFAVSILLHDDCGFGEPTYDAPGTAAAADKRVLPADDWCQGSIGARLPVPVPNPPLDAYDWYTSPHRCEAPALCKVRVTATAVDSVTFTVILDDGVTQQSASCGGGGGYGCETTVESLLPSAPDSGAPRVGIRLDGAKGRYRVKVETVPLL